MTSVRQCPGAKTLVDSVQCQQVTRQIQICPKLEVIWLQTFQQLFLDPGNKKP